MDNVVFLPPKERSRLIRETAEQMGLNPGAVEKDFWVVWVLSRLFSSDLLADKILFKGGTSLSKVFGLIRRFSEDIDLILDWNEVVSEDPNIERSKKKQDQFNKAVPKQSRLYIEKIFLPEVMRLVGDVCTAEIEAGAPDVINIRYPSSFESDYLRPEIRLEIGPLALWVPNARYGIGSYVAEVFPGVFENPTSYVNAIKAERTFWEKATILHAEAFRPEHKPHLARYSRHYYDLAMMTRDESTKSAALSDLELLHSVVVFKAKFYPASWASYDLAKPGTFKLLPPNHNFKSLSEDYKQMQVMFYGEVPVFDDLMETLQRLEDEINALEAPMANDEG